MTKQMQLFDSAGRVQMYDRAELNGTRRTADGYLVTDARVARTGIQQYRGFEVGRPEKDIVNVYRPEDEVFSRDSMASYAFRPITNDHPPEAVTSDNWKEYSAGMSDGQVARDGESIRVPMTVMDGGAIKDIEAGKREISCGYTCDLDWTAGTTPDGQTYDAVQRDIRVNHIAVVQRGRAGPEHRIGDEPGDPVKDAHSKEKEPVMATKQITVDGLPVTMEDRDAEIVSRHINKLSTDLDTATKARDAAEAKAGEHEAAIATKDAEIATLKKQLEDAKLTPAQIDQLVKDRAEVAGKAKAVLGDKLEIDGKSVEDMRKQVVTAKMGDAAKDWTDAQIAASFASLTADVKAETVDPLGKTLATAQTRDDRSALEQSYAERDKRMADAWRSKPAA